MTEKIAGKSILLVDDDTDLLEVLSERCRQLGMQVQTARNLLTAMMLVGKQCPDILSIDVDLPSGNGLSFCKMLRENQVTAEIPVVVLTGRRDATTKQACVQFDAKYICKSPDAWSNLKSEINSLLTRQRRHDPPVIRVKTRSDIEHRAMPHITLNDAAQNDGSVTTARTVVIAEDDQDLLQLLSLRFSDLGCSVIATDNAIEAINSISTIVPDIACLDVNMPSGNGLSVCEMMSNDEKLRHIPVLMLTGQNDPDTIRRCHDMTAYYVEKNTEVWSRVEPIARQLLKTNEPAYSKEPERDSENQISTELPSTLDHWSSPDDLMDIVFDMLAHDPDYLAPDGNNTQSEISALPWVLCIDDDADYSEALKLRLEAHGVAVSRAFDGMAGYRTAFQQPASAILLDYEMPNGQGDYVLGRLKDNPVTMDIPVTIVTGVKDKMLERKMYNLGASGFLNKPVQFADIRNELARHIDILAIEEETATLG